MKTYSKPAPIEPSGRPECAPNEDHWTRHWTVADCIKHFVEVPRCLAYLDPKATIAGIWHHLKWPERSKLDQEFVFWDLRTGRV